MIVLFSDILVLSLVNQSSLTTDTIIFTLTQVIQDHNQQCDGYNLFCSNRWYSYRSSCLAMHLFYFILPARLQLEPQNPDKFHPFVASTHAEEKLLYKFKASSLSSNITFPPQQFTHFHSFQSPLINSYLFYNKKQLKLTCQLKLQEW